MKRYAGERLTEYSRIAVIANDAIGNFVVSTPLLQMFYAAYPKAEVHYFSGPRVRELLDKSDLFDQWHSLAGCNIAATVAMAHQLAPFELVFVQESTALAKVVAGVLAGESGWVCGPCVGPSGRGELPFAADERGQLWSDQTWTAPDLTDRYSFLESGFIGEIFCRLAFLAGNVPMYRVPSAEPPFSTPDVLVATDASLPEKLWLRERWDQCAAWLKGRGLSVGVLGAPPRGESSFWKGEDSAEGLIASGLAVDLRGKLTLPEVVGALERARCVLTLDNGIMHLAAAALAPTVALFRHGIHRLWAPPSAFLRVLQPGEDGSVTDISANMAISQLEQILAARARLA